MEPKLKSVAKRRPAGTTVSMSNADYVVHKSGALVRVTERPEMSRNQRNNSVRRRIAKGK